ncbi:MAG: cell division protein FtsQ [Agathobacter sp.]|nr:cell division protein FtsQ [Agathobacter sp.]
MIREQRRRARKKKKILIALLVFVLVMGAAGFAAVKLFVVEQVEVEGNVLYNSDVIETAVLNDKYSWNSLYVFVKYRFVDTEPVPFVDTMEITLKDPKTLHIKVYEKGMMGCLYIPSIQENAYFDKDGFVVETSSRKIPDVPVVKGLDCDQVVLYEKLPIDGDKLREILTLTQALKRAGLVPDSVTYGVDHAPVLGYGGITVNMGPLDVLTQKVERLEKVMPKISGEKGTLHLETWTEETTNIVFNRAE